MQFVFHFIKHLSSGTFIYLFIQQIHHQMTATESNGGNNQWETYGLTWGHSFIQQTTLAGWDCQPL